MYRRNSVNINELINRFEPTDDDSIGMAENVNYVKVTRPKGKMYTVHDEEESSYDDENSLIRYTDKYNWNKKKRSNALEITKQTVAIVLSRISVFLEMVSKFPFPRLSVMSYGLTSLLAIFICPRGFTERALYPGFKLVFSVIYPAYRSFKAVRNKNLKEYLKWIVYWIVYAFFTCIELLTDALLSWFPFYYEIKVISFIWLLGPSSRGAMKVYKTLIHPMLVSREQVDKIKISVSHVRTLKPILRIFPYNDEQEIDDVIQIAQDRGYMHVFRFGSKSVNYANRIIMQETKAPDNNLVVSHQLMKNISLSNLSDADNDVDDSLRLRKFSLERIPVFEGQTTNFGYDPLTDQRRYRYDEISSGYSSPESPPYYRNPPQMRSQAYIEEGDDKEMYNRKLSRNSSHSSQSEMEKQPIRHFDGANRDVPNRRASRNELSKDEISSSSNELKRRAEIEVDARLKNEDFASSNEMKEEFLRWIEMKRGEEISHPSETSSVGKSIKKVNADVKESDVVSVVNSKHEPEASVNDTVDVIDEASFDEFKDVISDNEQDSEDYLKVPLVIEEECDEKVKQNQVDDTNLFTDSIKSLMPSVTETKIVTEIESTETLTLLDENTIDAKITLGNAPLEVVTSLSSSNFSLASDMSLDEAGNVKKRPANHSKGRAPLPPQPSALPSVPGQFFDHVTKKFFKETEL